MFYLKYRPQTIEEIDNEEIRKKVAFILATKNIPHAFLFAGPKGVGKTSTARIIAKAINCQNNLFAKKSSSVEPCNRCQNCLSITAGNAIDVFELDAASHRKIDDIRDLIDKVKFAPLTSRFKVYIIDEVHMLTIESFNALLKTIEEPPQSTIFILATTEINKLPKTIVSRCITLNFGKAKKTEILRMLKRITQREKIPIEEKTLPLIATYGDNSFRDAAKLLEEMVMNIPDKKHLLSSSDLKKILGFKDENVHFLKIIEKKDLSQGLQLIEDYAQKGGDFKTLIEYLLDKLHLLLLRKNQLETDLEEDYNFSLKEIAQLIKLLQEAYNNLKYSPIESLPLEIAVVEYLSLKI